MKKTSRSDPGQPAWFQIAYVCVVYNCLVFLVDTIVPHVFYYLARCLPRRRDVDSSRYHTVLLPSWVGAGDIDSRAKMATCFPTALIVPTHIGFGGGRTFC